MIRKTQPNTACLETLALKMNERPLQGRTANLGSVDIVLQPLA